MGDAAFPGFRLDNNKGAFYNIGKAMIYPGRTMYEEQIKHISLDDLKRRMKLKDQPLLILDAREIAAFDQGHIPGASDIYDP